VCKAFLRAIGASKRGSDLRNIFTAPPYGWPKDAVDAAMVVLANASEVKVTGADHKPVVLASQPISQWGTCTFAPENIVVSTTQRMAVRAIGTLVGLTVAAGEEGSFAISIVDKLAAIAADAGGDAPAPAPPSVPGLTELRAASGNALLVELAARLNDLKAAVPKWQADKSEKEKRLRDWTLVQRLINLGAEKVRAEAEAIHAGRSLLSEPNPLPNLVSTAADDLRTLANAAYGAWQTAWSDGEARLKTDAAWDKLDPEKRHDFRLGRGLLPRDAPDLSTPTKIAESLGALGLSQWRDMIAALPSRVEGVLQDAAIELEPKTQKVAIPKPSVIKSVEELDAWLAALRAAIAPHLSSGPVLPTQ
jgi:hypothetical protein